MNPFRLPLAIALVVFALAACAAPPQAGGWKMVAQTVSDWTTPAAFAERAEALAGVPLRDVRAIGARSYAFTLACPDDAACQQALRRLREPSFTVAVERDARRGIPTRPAASQSL